MITHSWYQIIVKYQKETVKVNCQNWTNMLLKLKQKFVSGFLLNDLPDKLAPTNLNSTGEPWKLSENGCQRRGQTKVTWSQKHTDFNPRAEVWKDGKSPQARPGRKQSHAWRGQDQPSGADLGDTTALRTFKSSNSSSTCMLTPSQRRREGSPDTTGNIPRRTWTWIWRPLPICTRWRT